MSAKVKPAHASLASSTHQANTALTRDTLSIHALRSNINYDTLKTHFNPVSLTHTEIFFSPSSTILNLDPVALTHTGTLSSPSTTVPKHTDQNFGSSDLVDNNPLVTSKLLPLSLVTTDEVNSKMHTLPFGTLAGTMCHTATQSISKIEGVEWLPSNELTSKAQHNSHTVPLTNKQLRQSKSIVHA